MYLLNHFISKEDIEDMPGAELHRYITFDINVCDYFGEKDKKILHIEFHLDEYIVEGEESSWHGRKSSNHVIDIDLKDKEDIYSIACGLSCILDNGFGCILEKINPRCIEDKKPVIEFPKQDKKVESENSNKFDLKNYIRL